MAELAFFDFDSTLFRSPHEPEIWDGDWWNNPASLVPPCVPDKPGDEWWISSTVSDAKRAIADPDVLAVLATGRGLASGLRYRVPELLQQEGLNFDEVHLAPPSGTLSWKKQILKGLLEKHPYIDTVRIWDDRGSHIPELVAVAKSKGIKDIHVTQVHADSKDPECGGSEAPVAKPLTRPPAYIGVFLTAHSRAVLVHHFPYTFNKAEGGHVTLAKNVTPQWLARIGERVTLQVTGIAEDDQVQAATVRLPSGISSDNQIPHVTISHTDESSPKAANAMLAHAEITPVHGVTVEGVIDVFPRTLIPSASRVAKRFLGRYLHEPFHPDSP